MEVEVWADIPGYVGHYKISNRGRIVSKKYGDTRPTATQIQRGYVKVSLCREDKRKTFFVHKLVLLAFKGQGLPGQECAHLNGNRSDNRIENLAWMTRKENLSHREQHGTAPKGSNNPNAKLRDADARTIIEMVSKGCKGAHVAKLFGVNKNTVYDIVSGRSWSHLPRVMK